MSIFSKKKYPFVKDNNYQCHLAMAWYIDDVRRLKFMNDVFVVKKTKRSILFSNAVNTKNKKS